MLALALVVLCAAADPPEVVVDRDDFEITESCRVRVGAEPIPDAAGDGVIVVRTDGVKLDFGGAELRGAEAGVEPDAYSGCGLRIEAKNVTVRDLHVSGFKVGLHAVRADGLVVEECDVSDNFRQRLGSTPEREDTADWLWPHANDGNEWVDRYGAGLCIEDSAGVTVRGVIARDVQNGIILDAVTGAKVYDNDCSFLSGWGLALWRSSRNVISRNAFDFCVRGYSHEVYNRGQDSAGILMFEQCSENVISENSATHGGDGLFAFSGKEALGEVAPREDPAWYRRRGNDDNLIIKNDFSDAAAHGLETTFGFGNRIYLNRLVGNAICGLWGGYSQGMHVAANTIEHNGGMAYGLERGGVNIEHGVDNRIEANQITVDTCGVHLWWDPDEGIMATPWAAANDPVCAGNLIAGNVFFIKEGAIGVQLRTTGGVTRLGHNIGLSRERHVVADDESPIETTDDGWQPAVDLVRDTDVPVLGTTHPVGGRARLRGREHIIVGEWGPYDWSRPLLQRVEQGADRHVYHLLGVEIPPTPGRLRATAGAIALEVGADSSIVVSRRKDGGGGGDGGEDVVPYEFTVDADGETLDARGLLVRMHWRILCFPWSTDPREDADAWRAEAREFAGALGREWLVTDVPKLDLPFAGQGPRDLLLRALEGDLLAEAAAKLGPDRFGTIATTECPLPAGSWRLRTTSDDGIRVWLDDALVIDDWTWHAPKEDAYEFTTPERATHRLRVEHFELDGWAVLKLALERR